MVTFVGWGDVGNGVVGVTGADGKFRRATNRIETINKQWLVFRFDEPLSATALEGISGPGDSGGPALIQTEIGWNVAGISSTQCSDEEYKKKENWQEGEEGIYGVWEHYTRVSSYLDWIHTTIHSSTGSIHQQALPS